MAMIRDPGGSLEAEPVVTVARGEHTVFVLDDGTEIEVDRRALLDELAGQDAGADGNRIMGERIGREAA